MSKARNDFFADWGRQKNPIRQSDMSSMFESIFRCQKRWAMSHLYHDEEVKRVDKAAGLGIVVHNLIHEKLTKNRDRTIRQGIAEWEAAENSQIKDINNDKISEYEYFLDRLFKSKMFDSIRKRLVCSEKSFMVQIGDFWVAGTIDVVISSKDKTVTIIDHKTGYPPLSQFEMDHGYQSLIYAAAVRYGRFYDRPERVDTGYDYYRSFNAARKAGSTFEIGLWPRVVYAYYREYALAKRNSTRKARHFSTRNWKNHPVDELGNICIFKGDQKGPVYYQADVCIGELTRLEHSLKCAVAKCKSGLFDEMLGANCEKCYYVKKCMTLGSLWKRKKTLYRAMQELDIEID